MAGNPLASLPGLPQRPSLARSSASETRLTQPGIEAARSRKLNSAPTAAFRFTKAIPTDLVEMAKLPGLSYVRPLSELAEKFHMSQTLLRELNPGVEFERAGAAILVANVAEMKLHSGGATVESVPPTAAVGRIATTI